MRTFVLLTLAAAALLAFPTPAHAKIVVRKNAEDHPITFDVRAPNVPFAWYARHVRRTLHGDEISTVTIRIVRRGRIEPLYGRGSDACYHRDRRSQTTLAGSDSRKSALHGLCVWVDFKAIQ